MKKNLTKNITRYDDKMKFRFDKKTIIALVKSVCIAAVVAFILYFILNLIFALFLGMVVGCIALIIQIASVDGMTMLDYIKITVKATIDPKMRKKPYQMQNDEPYRICVLTSAEQKKKGERNEKETNMGNG